MSHLLIWGDASEILSGEEPPGFPVEEVRSLAALRAAVEGQGPFLVLADPCRLAAEKDAVEAWLPRVGAVTHVVLLAVANEPEAGEARRRFAFVDGLLPRPVTPACLLERMVEALQGWRDAERARRRKVDELSELNKIGVALSAERKINDLLELILSKSREITAADAGSLYLVERGKPENGNGDRLRFKLPQNDTVPVSGFEEFTIPLDETSIAGYVALTGEPLQVDDAYRLEEGTPYTISRSFDERSGYRSKSMLVVPMKDHKDVVIGVIQLINKKRGRSVKLAVSRVEQEAIPFTAVDAELARSLASQAAVAFENADLIERVQTLFEQFIHGAVEAVELRDPTTAGHSERVAVLAVKLIETVDSISDGPLARLHFTPEQVRELRYAALLHDFGKVGVAEKYLKKGKKLYATQLIAVRQRFAFILKAIEADLLRAKLDAVESGRSDTAVLAALDAEYARRRAEAERIRDAVLSANEPSVVEDDRFRALMTLPARPFATFEAYHDFPVEHWAAGPWVTADELDALCIRKGSLSGAEREEIESHVQKTYEFLEKMPWTSDLRRVPEIAWKHHEKLNGSGYPNGLRAPDIPVESRMMTIADIYDALVAWDRPYKKSVSVERALDILNEEASDGRLDRDLLDVFVGARIYDVPEFKARLQKKA